VARSLTTKVILSGAKDLVRPVPLPTSAERGFALADKQPVAPANMVSTAMARKGEGLADPGLRKCLEINSADRQSISSSSRLPSRPQAEIADDLLDLLSRR
jgi:hypothetical protein